MSESDYYKILGVSRDANAKDIKKAYRKMALKYHPDKNKGDKSAEEMFKKVAEAYDVLSDPEKRKLFDQYGKMDGQPMGGGSSSAGSAGGFPGGFAFRSGGGGNPFSSSYQFQGDPMEMFSHLFGSEFRRAGSFGKGSPFADGAFPFAMGGSGFSNSQQGSNKPNVRVDLACTLEELYEGTVKKMKITRKSTTLQRDASVTIEIPIKKGWKAGTKLTYQNHGDEIGNSGRAQDLEFVVREKKHALFVRQDNDLIFHQKISLRDALVGGHVSEIKLLSGKKIRITLDDGEIVTNKTSKIISNHGMPSHKHPGQFGDLVLTFEVVFPTSLSRSQQDELKRIL